MGSIKCSELQGLNLLEPRVLPLHRLLIPNLLHQQQVLQGIPVDHLTLVDRPILGDHFIHLLVESRALEEEFGKHCLVCARSMPRMCMK